MYLLLFHFDYYNHVGGGQKAKGQSEGIWMKVRTMDPNSIISLSIYNYTHGKQHGTDSIWTVAVGHGHPKSQIANPHPTQGCLICVVFSPSKSTDQTQLGLALNSASSNSNTFQLQDGPQNSHIT